MVAKVKPASVMILVRPKTSAGNTFGTIRIILNAPIAKPSMITTVDWMLCF
jgi:hypothetical protein